MSQNNSRKERDPERSATRKTNTWHFGAKGHSGVQAQGQPIIHSTELTTAKVPDSQLLDEWQHGDEQALCGDRASTKQADKRHARKDGFYYGLSARSYRKHPLSSSQKQRHRRHSGIRAKVEHPFRVSKHLWGHRKLRDTGLAKNAAPFMRLWALSNLFFCRRALLMAD